MSRLGIPNQTVKRLMYGYLRAAYRDVGVFPVNLVKFTRLVREMAYDGAWRPVLEFLATTIAAQTGIRDYLGGEKVVQGFLAAYLNVTDYYQFHSEYELNKGYADIFPRTFPCPVPRPALGVRDRAQVHQAGRCLE